MPKYVDDNIQRAKHCWRSFSCELPSPICGPLDSVSPVNRTSHAIHIWQWQLRWHSNVRRRRRLRQENEIANQKVIARLLVCRCAIVFIDERRDDSVLPVWLHIHIRGVFQRETEITSGEREANIDLAVNRTWNPKSCEWQWQHRLFGIHLFWTRTSTASNGEDERKKKNMK